MIYLIIQLNKYTNKIEKHSKLILHVHNLALKARTVKE